MSLLLSLVPVIITALPDLIKSVETLFNGKPKAGTEKLALVQSLIQNAAPIAEAADASQSKAIADLTTAVTGALVAFYNAVGEFKHS